MPKSLLFALILSVAAIGCGGHPAIMAPTSKGPVDPLTLAGLDPDPNPARCIGLPVVDGFGGCPLNSYRVHIGRVWEFEDNFMPRHHLFVRQEVHPGFNGATGVVWHYTKTDPATGEKVPGDDGRGYWCSGDPDAELFFGLTHEPADPVRHTPAGWYSTHQLLRCNGVVGSSTITGPGYLILADLPGDTGPETYSQCFTAGVLTWVVDNCASPGSNGWRTVMGRKNGNPATFQEEGPAVLGSGRFHAIEAWTFDGDMLAIQVIDQGAGIDKTDPRLSMHRVNIY